MSRKHGADVVLYGDVTPGSARSCARRNPRKKRWVDECADLYAGHEGLLVRTALIRSDKFTSNPVKISSSRDVASLCAHLRYSDTEYVVVLALNLAGDVTAIHELSKGGSGSSEVEPAQVLKVGLLTGSSSLIMVHNHPSGRNEPSREDVEITRVVMQACKCIGIALVDHVIIGSSYYSFLDSGTMPRLSV